MSAVMETFKFAQLSPKARQRAIEWYREGQWEIWEPDLDDIIACLRYLGIELDSDNQAHPEIHYRISWSQGDGAVFEGRWSAEAMDLAGLHQYTGDEVLHRLGAKLLTVLLCHPRAECRIITTSYGPGLGSMGIESAYTGELDAESYEVPLEDDVVDRLKSIMRGCADWIYTRLRDDLEYVTEEENCIDGLEANNDDFDEDGRVV